MTLLNHCADSVTPSHHKVTNEALIQIPSPFPSYIVFISREKLTNFLSYKQKFNEVCKFVWKIKETPCSEQICNLVESVRCAL